MEGRFAPPIASRAGEPFDFKLAFELSIFSILPTSIFLLVIALQLPRYWRQPVVIEGRPLQVVKIIALTTVVGLQAALVALWSQTHQRESGLGSASAALALVTATATLPLSWLQHERDLRPSSTAILYLSLSVLADIFIIRSLWLRSFPTSFVSVAIACCAAKLISIVLESLEKRRFVRNKQQPHSPSDWASFWNRSFCIWINPLMVRGYREVLTMDKLYPLQQRLHSGPLDRKFHQRNGSNLPLGKFGLAWALLSALGWEVLEPVPARLLLIGFKFCQPLLIKAILNYLQLSDNSTWPQHTDDFIICGMVLTYLGLAVCSNLYAYVMSCLLAKIRSMLVSAIYRKVTALPLNSTDKSSLTLMNADIMRVASGLQSVHDVWGDVAEVGIAIWLLERELGVGTVGPVVLAICCFLATLLVSRFTMSRQNSWMKALERRVGTTSSVISSMKGIKMTGLSDYSGRLLQSLRITELSFAARFRAIMASMFCIAFTPIYLSPVVCFGIYLGFAQRSGAEHSFDASKAFTSLSIVVLLTSPLSSLFQYVTPLLGAADCLGRIQDFLRKPIHADPRIPQRTRSVTAQRQSLDSQVVCKDIPISVSVSETHDEKDADAFNIRNGQFGWKAGQPALTDVSLSIPRGKLTLLIGPVASGKSTLCKALLGEVPESTGEVSSLYLNQGIAFCDQVPFLTNATLRQNIVGFSSWDENWYRDVLQAVTLSDELDALPQGDETLLGSEGVALSTGQRQRVAVARAIYARNPAIIIDDVFSGMDNITTSRIFDGILGNQGLLRRLGTTVVLVTQDKQFLGAADQIILLQDGSPPKSITQEEASSKWNVVMPQTSSTPEKSEESAPAEESTPKTPPPANEEKLQKVSDWRVYRYYANALGPANVVIMVFLGLIFAFLYTFPSIWLKWWTENVGKKDNFYMGIYAMLQTVGLAVWFLFAYHILTTSIAASGRAIHERLLNTIMGAPMSWLSKRDTGIIINKFSQDLEVIDDELPGAMLNTLATALIAISQIAMITTVSPWIALSYPLILAVLWGIQKFYLRTSQQIRPLSLESKSPLYSHFLDTIRGISTLRAFGWCQEHIDHNNDLVDTSQRPTFLMSMIQQWLAVVLKLLMLGIAALLCTLALKLRSSTGFAGVALINLMSLNQMLSSVLYGWMLLETSISAVARVKEFEEETPREVDQHAETGVHTAWPTEGKVECRDLKASYGPLEETMALKGVSITFEAHQSIGICGRSGSGKSSLLASIFRMLDIRSGTITIDSVDIQSIPLSTLRSRINAIPQDPFFIPGTFRDNIDPFGTASLETMQSTLEKVQLWAKVERSGGLDGQLEPETLSQGQKQLLSLARAMLRPRCSVVIMDEVTSSLDSDTEEIMMRVLRETFKDCTIIAIAHKLDTILGFDKVAVVESGTIAEYDDPKMLLENNESALSRLVAAGEM